jgi:glycerol kinase
MRTILAIDQGTTGTTVMVVAPDGRVLSRAYREVTQYYPQPGWVEHDAEEIFAGVCTAAREAIAASGTTPEAIGITNQRETLVVWEQATGHPVHPAIVWQDRRTAERCRTLDAAMIARLTGLVPDAYFSATKLEWILQQGSLRDRAWDGELLAGTIDSWLIWRLTNGAVHATDPTNASRTMLYDIDARGWNDDLLGLFDVPRHVLPSVRPSSGEFGIASAQHLGVAIPIRGVAGDQQAALFGQGGFAAGASKNTYGTGAFLLTNTGATRPTSSGGMLITLACDATGQPCYALESAIFVAGAAVQWLRDGLGIVGTSAETEGLAKTLDSNDGVYFVPALTGLGAPHWESGARGTIVGLTRGTTRAHLARAALEAMAFGTADVLGAMQASSGHTIERLRVDGGATANSWLMQMQADVLGVPVERPDNIESTAMGAAGLAGIASGVWADAHAFLAARHFTVFAPTADRAAVAAAYAGWQRAVRAALAWARDSATA